MSSSININNKPKNKKVIFGDDGEVLTENKVKKISKKLDKAKNINAVKSTQKKVKGKKVDKIATDDENDEGEEYFKKLDEDNQTLSGNVNGDDIEKKWYQIYPQYNGDDVNFNIKDHELIELKRLCKSSYESELPGFIKKNPSDGKWLQTALHKGTSKDRSNAGALLVTSNPLANLTTLETLISFSKVSNRTSPETVNILTDLFIEMLLPFNRKLLGINQRGSDWKSLQKQSDVLKESDMRKIYAFWHFENELKDNYFEFLKNLQQSLQTGQENNKKSAIISAARLLAKAPEKEQILLTMLINKLGDPSSKIASKALHHLSEVVYKHPNMCGVIIIEAEKLLFRNNISERAQHFALCFLAQIAPNGKPEVCTKLVHICFSLFKVLVQKGAVNNRTMQAILRCLQKAILEAKPVDGNTEIMTKDMQNTIYRLVHLADIRISLQTLSLLLQIIAVKSDQSDRFYNVLYKKLLDLNLTTIGTKTSAQFLHIVHRAIHIDKNIPRAQAFIKRLLQLSLYMPSQITAGILIVINKLLSTRSALLKTSDDDLKDDAPVVNSVEEDLSRFDSDGEEKYEDVDDNDEPNNTDKSTTNSIGSSWHHIKLGEQQEETNNDTKIKEIGITKYDPYHRVPAFAGADLATNNELLMLQEHFHPTVKLFAENILHRKKINYYGDPLKDFSLSYFLERFAFKNPKKLDDKKSDMIKSVTNKNYVPFGVRGKPVKSLTNSNCTEDERFILNYLEKKRETQINVKKKSDDNDDDDLGEDVNDDEFDAYMDRLSGKNKDEDELDNMDMDINDEEEEDQDLDFLKEIGGEIQHKNKMKKSKKSIDDSDNDIDNDWGDDNGSDNGSDNEINSDIDEDGSIDFDGEDSGSDDESISLPDENDDDGDDDFDKDDDDSEDDNLNSEIDDEDDDDDDDDGQPKSKKSRLSGKQFSNALKHKTDMSSLFAAADDFAELLEESGKAKGQGTSNAISNRDNVSEKHLKWEEKRRSNYGKQKNFNKNKKMGKNRRK